MIRYSAIELCTVFFRLLMVLKTFKQWRTEKCVMRDVVNIVIIFNKFTKDTNIGPFEGKTHHVFCSPFTKN